MAILSKWLRVPKPRKFLYVMSLRTGVEMITLSMIFNKVTGFYGLLAILTGFTLNPTQLSMYIYSVAAVILIAFLIPHARKQSPLHCLALAWFYLFDTIINCVYTAAFAVTWFLTVSATDPDTEGGVPGIAPGSGTINDTAGFTSPKFNVTEVNIVATPATGLAGGEEAVAIGAAATATAIATAGNPSLGHGVQLAESMPSIVIIIMLMLIRLYFVLIMMAFARQVLRQYINASSSTRHLHVDGAGDEKPDNPFAPTAPQGQGWQGKLGRIMVAVGKGYWLGGAEDDEWARDVGKRFKAPVVKSVADAPGTLERERRARKGTGPPRPSADVMAAAQA